jgi:Zn-dependent peptidase ImmA (M78 family)
VEREANEFASWLLMPLDDFRKQISPTDEPDFGAIVECADRYEVSLVAAVLRWLRSTDRRSIFIKSIDGYIDWARSSEAAFKTASSYAQAEGRSNFRPDRESRRNILPGKPAAARGEAHR